MRRPWLIRLDPLDTGGYEAVIALPDLRIVRAIVHAPMVETFDAAATGEAIAAALGPVSHGFYQRLEGPAG